MINELKEDLRNELRKKTQDMKEHFNKEIQILQMNQTGILEMKNSINQIKAHWRTLPPSGRVRILRQK